MAFRFNRKMSFTCAPGCAPLSNGTCDCGSLVMQQPIAGAQSSLGLIPQWQFSQDPAVNYNLNPHLTFPPGMNQLTVQPINNVVPSGDANLQGLGITMAQYAQPGVGVKGLGFFDTWWWNNRKWLALGALGILGLAVAGVATKVLR